MKAWVIPLVAILAITALEIIALVNGVNGQLLRVAVAAIGAIAGGGVVWGWISRNLVVRIGKDNGKRW